MVTPIETEVKLRAERDDLPAVVALIGELAAVDGSPVTKRLESKYFDTPELTLHRNRIALRVRKTPEKFIQTIKTAGDVSGGLLSRGEWECDVANFAPDLTFEDSPLDLSRLGELSELFVTRIDRQKLIVMFPPYRADASQIEVAIDTGQVAVAGGQTPITEVELELVEGHPADLFELGGLLAEKLPLRFETDTKAARGYRLATGELPIAEKAGKLQFDPGVSLEDGMQAALKGCVRQWFANQTAAFEGRDIEGVHQMRVGLRRLRSAFVFFADYFAAPELALFRDDARWIANALGPARDWDVFLSETLPPVLAETPRHPGLIALEAAAIREREIGYEAGRIAIMSPRYSVFALRLCAWIEREGWREPLDRDGLARLAAPMIDHAGPLLARRHRKVLKAGASFNDLNMLEKHALRIAMKKLRYAGDFFRSLYPKDRVKPFRASMTAMLDLLGKLNDLTVADQLCGALKNTTDAQQQQVKLGSEALLHWHAQRAAESDARLGEAWQKFTKARPYWSPGD